MLTISVHHPQIHDFVKIKRNLRRVTGANISVRLSDEFMNAVVEGENFQLRFPVDADDPKIKRDVDARELWTEIVGSAHACAEPGLLFWDTAKNLSPADVYTEEGFGSSSTNPCGEIILSAYDSCRLMLVNLLSFVKEPYTDSAWFDYDELADVARKAQRLMDDMVDLEIEQVDKILEKIESDPEPGDVKQAEKNLWTKIRRQAMAGRRTGLGVTAVGDAIAAMGEKYGSADSIKSVEKIYKTLTVNAYRSSCTLAKERGAFEVHSHDRERSHKFLERIWKEAPDVYEMSKKYGRRNIALTTTAPAGSVSVLTQTTSGIEPAYMLTYKRRKKLTENDKSQTPDFVDASGDKWIEFDVLHHGLKRWSEVTGEEDFENSPYHNATAPEIDWVAKVRLQAAAQKWICHAISNTTNVPRDIDVETVKKIYIEGWKLGCKGVTVYRDGSRDGVLLGNGNGNGKKKKRNGRIVTRSAPKRPEELKCDIHHATIKGEKWTILVGRLGTRPYEIMGGLAEVIEIPKKYSTGTIRKRPRKTRDSIYDLKFGEDGDDGVIKDIVSVFDNPNHSSFTRTISLALRHGAPIQYIVEQLQKDKDADLYSFSRVIARVMKKYIKNGTKPGKSTCDNCGAENALVYQEGCAMCKSCGHGKCG